MTTPSSNVAGPPLPVPTDLRRLRLALGLTQVDAGLLVGWTGAYVSRLERGRKDSIEVYARALTRLRQRHPLLKDERTLEECFLAI